MFTVKNLNDWLSIAANLAVVGGTIWVVSLGFPALKDALRGWPAHPSVEGCAAVRNPPPADLVPASYYVEFGVSISNPTDRYVVLDSVRLRFWGGSLTDRVKHTKFFHTENASFVEYHTTVAADEVFKPESDHRALAGFGVRPNETKHVFRGIVVSMDDVRGPYAFEGHVFFSHDTIPFAYSRPMWLTDLPGRCPWNAQ